MDYEADFYAWTQAQAAALRKVASVRPDVGADIDWEHIAEELELMGTSERAEIESRLQVVLAHLLKLALVPQPEPRHGWRRTVREQRDRLEIALRLSPSLKKYPATVLAHVYGKARRDVVADYGVRDAPEICPFDLEREILAEGWFPLEPN
jgi:hypothetical protein